ncbi:hypothetical protein [Streptomyces sp. BR123]|uniref:hypothetical protein n=1 Tax=Streptomyces sp. BR123 TaxID=2749828 RepID=UPI00211ABEA8|nr:hypothetical protein [Streptomyces sp. BR123]
MNSSSAICSTDRLRSPPRVADGSGEADAPEEGGPAGEPEDVSDGGSEGVETPPSRSEPVVMGVP